jgi:hypothetical protein
MRRMARLQFVQVWACDLRTIAEPCGDHTYEFRPFDADDLCRLAADPANDLPSEVALQLADDGHQCFGALDGPNLVCYVWCAQRNISPEHTMGIPFSLPADACYLFKAFTVPAYRGRRLYNLTARRTMVELCRLGKTRGIALIEYGNRASMRSHDRIGMQPQGWIASLGRGRRACRWYAAAVRQCGFGNPLT